MRAAPWEPQLEPEDRAELENRRRLAAEAVATATGLTADEVSATRAGEVEVVLAAASSRVVDRGTRLDYELGIVATRREADRQRRWRKAERAVHAAARTNEAFRTAEQHLAEARRALSYAQASAGSGPFTAAQRSQLDVSMTRLRQLLDQVDATVAPQQGSTNNETST